MIGLRARQRNGNGTGLPRRVHLVGAGGMHMSAIGQILLGRGTAVSGSDIAPSEYTERLEALGGQIFTGHDATHIGDAELVVTTAAAKADNPELIAARERGLPVILRAEMVQRLIADRELLAIAGTHGKTTTTSMLALAAVRGELDPLVLLGGDSPELGGNVRDGDGRFAVVEADEYAEAFLQYAPRIALVTNIDVDHLDYYGSVERLRGAFLSFSQRIQDDGLLVACADSPWAVELAAARAEGGARVELYSLDAADSHWKASRIRRNDLGGSDFVVALDGTNLGEVSLRVPGRHNVSNALGALAVAMRAGVDFHRAAQAVGEFTGARRRFQVLGEIAFKDRPVPVVDDFSHHPTEVRAVISAARQRYPNRRIVACFQPHTYSRTQYLLEQFRTCFDGIDRLFVLRTYAAREDAGAGMDARALLDEIAHEHASYVDGLDEAADALALELAPGDVCFTIGAGDVTRVGPMLLERLGARP